MNQNDVFHLKAAASEKEQERKYWTGMLSDIETDCRFPSFIRHAEGKKEEASLAFTFTSELNKAVLKASGESDLRMFIILMAAAFALLHRYSGKNGLLAAAPVLNQEKKQTAINDLLPLKLKLKPSVHFRDCLQYVKTAFQEAHAHQNYPVKLVINEFYPQKAANQPFGLAAALENLHGPSAYGEMMSDLFFSFRHEEGKLSGKLIWNEEYYNFEAAEQLARHFCTLAEQVLAEPEKPISDVELLSNEERKQITAVFNETAMPYPKEKTIIDLFQQKAAAHPDRRAAVYENKCYTYREVDELSDRIGEALRKKGVKKGEPIGLMIQRSADMVIAILGILKAGCPYLPIDIHLPPDRVRYMLGNSGSRFVIANQGSGIQTENQHVIFLEQLLSEPADAEQTSDHFPSAGDLAYVLYTSGTTGKPKGVMVEHRQVVNLVYGIRSRHFGGISPDNLHIAMLASHIFDASVQTMFPALLLGHTLFIVPDLVRMDGSRIWSFFEENSIHISDATPSHLRLMVKAVSGRQPHRVKDLKLVLAGGEVLTPQLARQFLQTFGKNKPMLTNNYGPTECTVQSAAFPVPEDWDEAVIPIGSPMPNEQIFILNPSGHPVPIGVYGELCIGGDGVARGYIHQPELTLQKFRVPAGVSEKRLYHTGDLARWRADGFIEFLGRDDQQVKIRGFRIELEEIKKALLTYEETIRDAVIVAVIKENDEYLCAYLISDQEPDLRNIREYLAAELPNYMIPRRFIKVDEFPLNVSGKLDYQSLPDPSDKPETGHLAVKGHNETKRKIVSIFAEVLDIPESSIDPEDNFFDIGGSSFHIVEISNKIKDVFDQELSVVQLFQYTTAAAIADRLDGGLKPQQPAEDSEEEAEDLENIAQLLGGMTND